MVADVRGSAAQFASGRCAAVRRSGSSSPRTSFTGASRTTGSPGGGRGGLLKALPGWSRHRVPMTHGALFPDSARSATDLGPDAPLSILGFAEDMECLGDWTRALFEQEGRARGLG